jgi:anti-sigma regulatory factor (Ser/Thr protein kinase)
VSSTTIPYRFPARFLRLPDLQAAVCAACNAAGLGQLSRHRAELVIEEVFANTIHHGYLGESDNPVWLRAMILPDGLRLVYQDAAPPFDPLDSAALPGNDHVGGVGRVLINTLPRHAEYALIDQRNTLSLDFDLRD